MAKKTKIIVHCADTPAGMDIGAAEINQWHIARGWSAIGYAFVIRRSGALELGRDLDNDGDVEEETGAHAYGFNRGSIGVCLVGGKGGPNFTAPQLKMLKWLLSKFDGLEVLGHRDLPGVTKACPSFDVRHWLETGEVIV